MSSPPGQPTATSQWLSHLPSVDKVLAQEPCQAWLIQYGRDEVLRAIRATLASLRQDLIQARLSEPPELDILLENIAVALKSRATPNLRRVINLTGTVLHTNLGRAVMPPEVIEAMSIAAAEPCALEYDLGQGERGDRDEIVEELLCELTGAEAATVVNNNAAAVFLLLNALSNRKETIVSRGELIEIGGSFRIPDIMKRAGAKLVEVGTTNRTHLKDFSEAISTKTALLMKVHTSNYVVQGFTAEVPEAELAQLAHAHQLPFVVDLGSGTLIDLARYGLPSEPTPRQAFDSGADLVTFSCDKLLGGPQAGILVGRRDLIQKIKKNPLKRILRVGKVTLAGLEAVLRLYRNPDALPQRLAVLQLLTRPAGEMETQALRLIPQIQAALNAVGLTVSVRAVKSQIGSGSLPVERLPSIALALEAMLKVNERLVVRLERLLRASDIAVIGRLADKALLLDLRCMSEDKEGVFVEQTLAAVHHLSRR